MQIVDICYIEGHDRAVYCSHHDSDAEAAQTVAAHGEQYNVGESRISVSPLQSTGNTLPSEIEASNVNIIGKTNCLAMHHCIYSLDVKVGTTTKEQL